MEREPSLFYSVRLCSVLLFCYLFEAGNTMERGIDKMVLLCFWSVCHCNSLVLCVRTNTSQRSFSGNLIGHVVLIKYGKACASASLSHSAYTCEYDKLLRQMISSICEGYNRTY